MQLQLQDPFALPEGEAPAPGVQVPQKEARPGAAASKTVAPNNCNKFYEDDERACQAGPEHKYADCHVAARGRQSICVSNFTRHR